MTDPEPATAADTDAPNPERFGMTRTPTVPILLIYPTSPREAAILKRSDFSCSCFNLRRISNSTILMEISLSNSSRSFSVKFSTIKEYTMFRPRRADMFRRLGVPFIAALPSNLA
jgi:hypothetical protein